MLGQEALKPNESSTGWRSDADKNLPGIKKLFETFPNAKWYIMIDDDTYLFRHNLLANLANYDHQKRFYFGSATKFMGCDGVTKFGQGPAFAHGGSGIIISHGAMQAMLGIMDRCIDKYKTCWAGDVRLSLCLRDAGILIDEFPGFHGDPPLMFLHEKPCHQPVTFHHLLIKQIQQIWIVEHRLSSINTFNISISDILQPMISKTQEYMLDLDMPGNDIINIHTKNATICQELCRKTKECIAFSYTGDTCWLKDSIPSSIIRQGVISGILSDKYKC